MKALSKVEVLATGLTEMTRKLADKLEFALFGILEDEQMDLGNRAEWQPESLAAIAVLLGRLEGIMCLQGVSLAARQDIRFNGIVAGKRTAQERHSQVCKGCQKGTKLEVELEGS